MEVEQIERFNLNILWIDNQNYTLFKLFIGTASEYYVLLYKHCSRMLCTTLYTLQQNICYQRNM